MACVARALLIAACGTTLPERYVLEHDLGRYAFRRYQKSLDVEIPIADNAATGHTAAYLQRANGDKVAVVTAFVTVYAHAKSLAAEVRAGLSHLPGYSDHDRQARGSIRVAVDLGNARSASACGLRARTW